MTRVAIAATAIVAAIVLVVLLLGRDSSTGPEPIAYGRDACARCRMIISQPGYAAELRHASGNITKYDDIGCLLEAMLAGHAEMPGAWVEDHQTAELVPLLTATLVRVRDGSTPMAHDVVAFASEDAARRFTATHGGTVVALEEVIHDPKTIARTRPDRGAP